MVLINPKSTKFGIFDRYVPLSVPISIGCLAGYLLDKGKKVRILDEHIQEVTVPLLEETLRFLEPPYLFGITTLTACVKRTFELAAMIKGRFPESKIILGGIHPTVLTEDVLSCPHIDFVVKGEGEEPLLRLYDALKNNGDYSTIKGISFKRNAEIVHNEWAGLPDLRQMPSFPYHLFEEHLDQYNFGFIASSRGCPYDCIFCSQRSISGQAFRYVPSQIVVEEIDLLINKYHQSHINFVDDNFTVNRRRVKELLEAMEEREFFKKATFDCQTRADAVDDSILRLLKKAGFRLINFGLETSSERLMVMLNKGETVADNVAAVRLAKKHGFSVSGTFIFGLPTETRAERWQAFSLAKELDLDYVRFNNATPYPGTKLYEIAQAEKRLFVQEYWANLNACASLVQDPTVASHLPYVPVGCDEKTLKKDIIRANLLFSLRPKRVIKLMTKRIGPAGWFYLVPRWYLKPKEWYYLLQLAMRLLTSLIKCFV